METLHEFAPLGPGHVGFLLQEAAFVDERPEVIEDNGQVARFKAIFQRVTRANESVQGNRNKRFYRDNVLMEAISSVPVQEKLRTRTLFGEANHPFEKDLTRQMVVDKTRISHLITRLSPPDSAGLVRGMVETAATACGRDMRGLIVENKSCAAFSMRGIGAMRKHTGSGLLEVVSPLALTTYDWVDFPSHSEAYMERTSTTSVTEGGMIAVTEDALAAFVRDQSRNVQDVIDQFEMEGKVTVTEDQAKAIITSSKAQVMVFLETDIRREFLRAFR